MDDRGRTVRLLGVNRSGAEYACAQGWGFFDGPVDAQSIRAMTAWKIDAVRIPLNEDCWLGINGVKAQYAGANYRSAIVSYVAMLNAAKLTVILDLHWNAPGTRKALGQQEMPDATHAPAFWRSVATTFRRNRNVVFELYNEPHGISWQCWRDGCVLPEGWRTAGMQTLVDAVRSTGATQPIIATGLNSGNDLSSWLRYRPHDPSNQLVAGFHVYNFVGCVTVACWNENAGPVTRSVPVITTELGEGDCTHAFIDRFMTWADSARVSYLGWSWNPSGCAVLITSWNGQPTAYGQGLRTHLIRLHNGSGHG